MAPAFIELTGGDGASGYINVSHICMVHSIVWKEGWANHRPGVNTMIKLLGGGDIVILEVSESAETVMELIDRATKGEV